MKAPRRRRTKAEIARAKSKALAARKHHLKTMHHMTLDEYDAIKAFQGGVCFMCERANGATKALAVEHDHKKAETCWHPVNESCRDCWRGLSCSTCNKGLAHARDRIEHFERVIEFLRNPPAQRWLNGDH